MKQWAVTLMILSLLGNVAKHLLPKGKEKTVTFLVSLCLLLALFTPFLQIKRGEIELPDFKSILPHQTDRQKGEEMVLERFGEMMGEALGKAFPEETITLEIFASEDGIPERVRITCRDRESARQIADYVQIRYGIEAEGKGEEDG